MFFLGFIFKRNCLVKYLLISYIFILMAFNTYNADFENYQNMYNAIGNGTYGGWITDFGYVALVNLGNSFGLTYADFLIVYFGVTALLLLKIVNKYSAYPNAVLSLILLYPLFINIIQLRSFLALLIIVYALQYLTERNFKNIAKFITAIVLATSLHLSSIFFGILLIFFIRNRVYILILGILAFILLIAISPFLVDLINTISVGKLDSYTENNYITLNKVIRTISIGMASIILIASLKYTLIKDGAISKYDNTLANVAILILLLSSIAILFSNEFERYSRLGYLLSYILYFNILATNSVNQIKKILLSILFSATIFGYIFFQYYFRASNDIPFAEAVFQTIIENNSLIGIN
nr:EpsG family protein [Haemophilus paracuniculus]